MLIRREAPEDIDVISVITREAFADNPHSRQTEALIVEALRAAGALTVSLVAEEDGVVCGHVAFSPALIGGEDRGWVGLGPISVRKSRQRHGIGTALMVTGLGAVRAEGARGCVLVGEPAFYERFGFRQAAPLHLPGVPAEVLLARAFEGPVPAGEVSFHVAFGVTAG